MRLRNGKTYSFRWFANRQGRNNSDKKQQIKTEKMATGSGSGSGSTGAPVYTVINARSSIQNFQGKVNGTLTQGVEAWISSIEAHLAGKRITDEYLALQEAKSFIDYQKGDVGKWCRTISFTECNSWTDFKTLVRHIYGGNKTQDEVLMLSDIFRMMDRGNNSLLTNTSLVGDRLVEYTSVLADSEWVNDDKNLTMKMFRKLIQLAMMAAQVPSAITKSFDDDLTKNSSEVDVMDLIIKHADKVPDLDPSIVNDIEKPKKTMIGAVTEKRYNTKNTGSTGDRLKSNITCYNCNRPGHIKSECNSRYCSLHKTSAHSYAQCRARNNSGRFKRQYIANKQYGNNQNRSYQQNRSQPNNSYNSNRPKQQGQTTAPIQQEQGVQPLTPDSNFSGGQNTDRVT